MAKGVKRRHAVLWTMPALRDLLEIADHIRVDNARAAAHFAQQIKAKVSRLAAFPQSGREVPEFPGSGLRELLIGDYRVMYRVVSTPRRVEILTLRHGARRLGESQISVIE